MMRGRVASLLVFLTVIWLLGGSLVPVSAQEKKLTITLDEPAEPLVVNSTYVFTGGYNPPLIKLTLKFVFIRPDGTSIVRMCPPAIGGGYGTYNGSFEFVFTPDMAGNWTVQILWEGDPRYPDYAASSSPTYTFTVRPAKKRTQIILIGPTGEMNQDPYANITLGETVTIRGRLVSPEGEGIGGAHIEFEFAEWGGTAHVFKGATTDSDGYFSVTFKPTKAPNDVGMWVRWAGNDEYEAVQVSNHIHVEPRTFSVMDALYVAVPIVVVVVAVIVWRKRRK